ncbi:MAG: glycosyltransferase [Methanobrevibacter sp.]|jgi:glycosyltransferase involved in cell wall biosynthesis|nr:glycosyltransferase [Candidatus Methanoflexus mossambicus]
MSNNNFKKQLLILPPGCKESNISDVMPIIDFYKDFFEINVLINENSRNFRKIGKTKEYKHLNDCFIETKDYNMIISYSDYGNFLKYTSDYVVDFANFPSFLKPSKTAKWVSFVTDALTKMFLDYDFESINKRIGDMGTYNELFLLTPVITSSFLRKSFFYNGKIYPYHSQSNIHSIVSSLNFNTDLRLTKDIIFLVNEFNPSKEIYQFLNRITKFLKDNYNSKIYFFSVNTFLNQDITFNLIKLENADFVLSDRYNGEIIHNILNHVDADVFSLDSNAFLYFKQYFNSKLSVIKIEEKYFKDENFYNFIELFKNHTIDSYITNNINNNNINTNNIRDNSNKNNNNINTNNIKDNSNKDNRNKNNSKNNENNNKNAKNNSNNKKNINIYNNINSSNNNTNSNLSNNINNQEYNVFTKSQLIKILKTIILGIKGFKTKITDYLLINYPYFANNLRNIKKRGILFNNLIKYPLISIIIPVYNSQETITKAIKSCLVQDYPNIEILVIDDGSDKKVDKIIENFNNPNIKYFYKKNSGAGLTRNFGIEKSNGEFIFFLDSDDILFKDALNSMMNFALDDNLNVVSGRTIRYFKEIKKSIDWKPQIYNKKYIDNIHTRVELFNDTLATNKLYKKEYLLENDLKFTKFLFEDKIFSAQIYSTAEEIGILNQAVYIWNVNEKNSSITRTKTIKNFKERVDAIEYLIDISNAFRKPHIFSIFMNHDMMLYVREFHNYTENDKKELFLIIKEFYSKYKDYFYQFLSESHIILKLIEFISNNDYDGFVSLSTLISKDFYNCSDFV